MSTEHQQYSTENQADVIREYAAKRGVEIVRTFADAGKSGLKIDGRDSLKQLIDTVVGGSADFQSILVYDVSRWGRFQDADESAYYEYICKRAGITVHYCAEQFENDGSIASNIVKTVKRAMAGEYSRELSAKVFQGQCRLIELGYRQGGPAGFGLRRMLLDEKGEPKGQLQRGEKKSIQTDRVILVPGPEDEIAVVRRVYRMFLDERRTEREIAGALNAEGVRTDRGAAWTRGTVRELLTNEKYIGQNVFNRVSFKLKKARVRNPPEMWVRDEDAFTPIVDAAAFHTVRGIILARHRRLSDDEMLGRLREILTQRGKLSGVLIDEIDQMPSTASYRHRFGSLLRAYQLVGYSPDRDYAFIETNRLLRTFYPRLTDEVVQALASAGARIERDPETDLFIVNDQFRVSIVLSRYEVTASGSPRWTIRFDRGLEPDLTIAVRMDASNAQALDYYILPSLDVRADRLRVASDNFFGVDAYRYENLDYFFGMAQLVTIEASA
ncbi:MAG: recombinase family protein [Polyangiaceae bacterium]|nr:recombinase family protein [Polyangiaceae bacterium]